MATPILTSLGTAALGPVGAVLGALAGAYLDREYIAPFLDGNNEDKAPDTGSGPVIQFAAGSPIPILFGGWAPNTIGSSHHVGGIVLWSSDPYSITSPGGSGSSKRGGGATPPTTTWYCDLLIGFAGNQCIGIDNIYADGELVYSDAPAPQTFALEFRRSDSAPLGVVYNFDEVQQLTPAVGGFVQRVHWNMVLRNERDGSGEPTDIALAGLLASIQVGDDVGIRYDQLGNLQFSRKWLATNLGAQLTDSTTGIPLTRWRCVYRRQDPNGNIEVQLGLAPAPVYFPILDTNNLPTGVGYFPEYTNNDYTGTTGNAYVGPTDPNWSGLGLTLNGTLPDVTIDPADYPFNDNGNVGFMQFYVRRNQWRRGALRNPSPVYGEDWTVWEGQDDYDLGDKDLTTTSAYSLLTDDGTGNQISEPVGMATMAKMEVKGLNLSPFGNRVPNITAGIRESESASVISIISELAAMAGVSAEHVDTRAAVLDNAGSATNQTAYANTVTSGNYINRQGQPYLFVQAPTSAQLQFGRGNVLQIEDNNNTGSPRDADSITYRCVGAKLIDAGNRYYQIFISPRLQSDVADGKFVLARQFRSAFSPFSVCRIEGRTRISNMVEELLQIHDLEMIDVAGFLRPRLQDRTTQVGAIKAVDVQSLPLGAERGDPVPLQDSKADEVSTRVSVRYINAWSAGEIDETGYEFQNDEIPRNRTHASELVPAAAATTGFTHKRFDFSNHVMTGAAADALARRIAQLIADGRQIGEVVLNHRYIHFQENDIVRVGKIPEEYRTDDDVDQFNDRELLLKIQTLTQGNDGSVTVEFVLLQDVFNDPPAPVIDAPNGGVGGTPSTPVLFQPNYVPPGSIVTLTPILAMQTVLSDDTADRPGIYVSGFAPGSGVQKVKANIFRDRDSSGDFRSVHRLAESGTINGQVTGANALGSSPAPGVFDYASSISVRLYNGTLSSVTEEEAMAGANFALIGNELVCFVSATLESDGTYTVTGFRRGLWGTHVHIADGSSRRAQFVYLGNEFEVEGFTFVPMTAADIGRQVSIRLATHGQDVDGAPNGTDPSFQGWNARPLPPVSVRWCRKDSATGDVELKWDRRPRVRWSEFGASAVPRYDSSDLWTIELRQTDETLVRTVTGNSGMSYTYAAADQVTDATSGKSFQVWLYREGTYGNSPPNKLTVTAGLYLGTSDY